MASSEYDIVARRSSAEALYWRLFVTTGAKAALPRASTSLRADEVHRVVNAAVAVVARDLRIRAERPRSRDVAADDLPRDQRIGCRAGLDPIDDRGDRIVLIRADPAGAVRHAGRHEKPHEVGRVRAVRGRRLLVVLDAHQRLQDRVRPAVRDDQLAAARAELGEIRGGCIRRLGPTLEQRDVAI